MKQLLGIACVALAPLASADVIVVDAMGGGDFLEISQASIAANDGDTLLVKPGVYGALVLGNKSLNVLADAAGQVVVNDYVTVTGLSAGQEVLLSGFQVSPVSDLASLPVGTPLLLQSNMGSIRVVDVDVLGRDGALHSATLGAKIQSCAEVALEGCSIRGGAGGITTSTICSSPGGTGLWISSSNVVVSNSWIEGGSQMDVTGLFPGGNGGDGCHVSLQSTVHFYGSTLSGRSGGTGDSDIINNWDECPGGNGGNGLVVTSGSTAVLLDTVALGGAAGQDVSGLLNGSGGVPIVGLASILPGSVYALGAPRVERAPGSLQLSVAGSPGDLVYLSVSQNAEFHFAPMLAGTWLTTIPTRSSVIPLGTVQANGQAVKDFPLGGLPVGTEDMRLHIQAIVYSPGIGIRLGTARSLVLVDSSF